MNSLYFLLITLNILIILSLSVSNKGKDSTKPSFFDRIASYYSQRPPKVDEALLAIGNSKIKDIKIHKSPLYIPESLLNALTEGQAGILIDKTNYDQLYFYY